MTAKENDPKPEGRRPVLVLTAGGFNPRVAINALARRFPGDVIVIEEEPETRATVVRRRARRLGWPTALGQLATMIVSRLGKLRAARRTREIVEEYGLSAGEDPSIPVHRVPSLNHAAAREKIADLAPGAILTISCRILSAETLAAIPCPVVNFHAGINPAYRGQMGGYWSRVENDEANFGATLHLVDSGIDTGWTLYEARVKPSPSDTISTYPLLITAAGLDATIRALEDALNGTLKPRRPEGPSALRYPPPVWTWLWHGLRRGIW